MTAGTVLRIVVALAALGAVLLGLRHLGAERAGLAVEQVTIATTPATLYRPAAGPPAPAVVIAHGFAGSRQLMQSFSLTLARNGYLAIAFDFRGHGRNPLPLTGDVTEETGATRTLLDELAGVIAFARGHPAGDGRVALIGHSMASDIVVRAGVADPGIAATVAVSMFTEAATATLPRNLLAITGEWEGFLRAEALETVALATDAPAEEGVTYGDPAAGTARRAAVAAGVEHVGVLFSRDSMEEALGWLDATFARSGGGHLSVRGPWIVMLLGSIVALGWPLARLLPRLAVPPAGGAPSGWRALSWRIAVPALLTPLLLWPVETGVLPVLVADYLALHFALYGLIVTAILWRDGRLSRPGPGRALRIACAALAVGALTLGGFGAALDGHVASFFPTPARAWLILMLLIGTLVYMLSDEWLTRGPAAPRGAYAVSKLAFLASLALAVALDLETLFFLIIILPVILLFFLIYGLVSGWVWRATGHPGVAGLANAVAFAWALGVTFPLLGG